MRPCKHSPPKCQTCRYCQWCASPTLLGESYRRHWGESPEPDPGCPEAYLPVPPQGLAIVPDTVQARWVGTADLAVAAVMLAGKLPPDTSGVVGIPRSGMIPASIIATHLHVPLYELTTDGPRRLGNGGRGTGSQAGRPVVIDDTVNRGGSIARARAVMEGDAVYAAVYVNPNAVGVVDVYGELLAGPHILEWNLFNSAMWSPGQPLTYFGGGVATDLDGILCHDAESGGVVGTPYLLPRSSPCRLIVSGRPERHRAATEQWLRTWGVKWDRLELLPDDVEATPEHIAGFKAGHYRESLCGLYVESDPGQAERIADLSGKPVVCPRAKTVYGKVQTIPRQFQGQAAARLPRKGCGCHGGGEAGVNAEKRRIEAEHRKAVMRGLGSRQG